MALNVLSHIYDKYTTIQRFWGQCDNKNAFIQQRCISLMKCIIKDILNNNTKYFK